MVTIHARVDGELVNGAFHEGSDVKKGDVLAQIDPRPYQAGLDNALATLAKDQATLNNAKRDLARYQDTAGQNRFSPPPPHTQPLTPPLTPPHTQTPPTLTLQAPPRHPPTPHTSPPPS